MNEFRQQWETARALARMFPRFCHEEPVELVALVLIIALAALGDIFHFAHGTTCFCLGGEIVIVVWRLAMLRSAEDREDFRKALDRMNNDGIVMSLPPVIDVELSPVRADRYERGKVGLAFWCPVCVVAVSADEDGCCTGCGADCDIVMSGEEGSRAASREHAKLAREHYAPGDAAQRAAINRALRPHGCVCTWEAGDSPCPVHGEADT